LVSHPSFEVDAELRHFALTLSLWHL
jgi:hypothetical protein